MGTEQRAYLEIQLIKSNLEINLILSGAARTTFNLFSDIDDIGHLESIVLIPLAIASQSIFYGDI